MTNELRNTKRLNLTEPDHVVVLPGSLPYLLLSAGCLQVSNSSTSACAIYLHVDFSGDGVRLFLFTLVSDRNPSL